MVGSLSRGRSLAGVYLEQVDPVVGVEGHKGLLPLGSLAGAETGAEVLALADLRVDLLNADAAMKGIADDLLAFDDAVIRLAKEDPWAAELVKLRYFAGLSVEQGAEALGISRANAYRHWTYARAWLQCELEGDNRPEAV